MWRAAAACLLIGACGGATHVVDATPPKPDATKSDAGTGLVCAVDLSADLPSIAAQYGLPALAVAASDQQGVIGCGVTGVRKQGDTTPATVDDVWHLGSDTKAMTATLIAQAVEAGTLSWDMTLPQAFPGTTINPGYATVTLKMLLAHVGGAPGDIPADVWAVMHGAGTSQALRLQAVQMMLSRPPGATVGTYTYANAGYMMAGAALELATGKAWEQLMRERLFTPLGMASCAFGPNATPGTVDEPWGHAVNPDGTLQPLNADNPPSLGPAGTVHCSMSDWLAFLREHLNGENGDATVLGLTHASWTTLHTPYPGSDYALGWIVTSRPWAGGSGLALTHAGDNTLNIADAWIAPGIHRIFVSVANRGDDTAITGADAAVGLLVSRFP